MRPENCSQFSKRMEKIKRNLDTEVLKGSENQLFIEVHSKE